MLHRGDDTFLASLRLELQLSRFTPERAMDPDTVENEAHSVLQRIRRDQHGLLHWRSFTAPALSRQIYSVQPAPPETAAVINRCFHYLGTEREGLTLGLYLDSSRELPPAVSMTFSAFDLRSVEPLLPASAPPRTVLVLSRVYSFPWAPPNSFSFGFRRAVAWLKHNLRDLRLLITYVNPNLGFTGASYTAANWLELAGEEGTRYHYLDGEYITLRELERRFGVPEPQLFRLLGKRLQLSARKLEPLRVLAFPVSAELRCEMANAEFLEPSRLAG